MFSLFDPSIRPKGGRPPAKADPDHIAIRAVARTLREEGYTRQEIADRLGVTRMTLWNWDRMDAAG